MGKKCEAVLFWRNGSWHAGWTLIGGCPAWDGIAVAWIDGDRMYTKIVDKVHPIDVPVEMLQQIMK